ncbi:SulP family inorganic anion transporter [Streptomyces sp. NPDC016566]|uniref:SulP family inorganic anion transporter n=1 Tax=Streptomyces sp. NPDC016566 TaxID=3364967 RepID=UPI003701CD8B
MAEDAGGRSSWWRRLAPGLDALLGYQHSWLRGDLLAGVTVAAYLVPQVMAYAGVAGLPPVAGLWAILPALALYALFGSSRLLSVGPESTTALMTATVVGPLAGGDVGRYASLAAALAVTVGLLCLVARVVRFGFLADLLSRPVLLGYLAGVALIMMVDQLPRLTGIRTTGTELTRVARPHDAVEGLVPGLAGMHDIDDYPQARTISGLLVYRYDSPLFFANAEDFRCRALAAVDRQTVPVRWFVLNTEANVEVDITALDAVDELRRELVHRGVVFALARVKQDLLGDLKAYGLADTVGTDLIFPTLPTAVAAYREWNGER